MRTQTFCILIATVLATAAACGPSPEARRRAESAVAAAQQANAVAQAGEVIAARREAQTYFDSARANVSAKRPAAAAQNLYDAALFTRQESDSASGDENARLVASAEELEQLAGGLRRGTPISVLALDAAFARAQIAESNFHRARARAAWGMNNPAPAGAEMMMYADHLERAAADAGRPPDDAATHALANARAIAEKLTRGQAVIPADVDAAMRALDLELRRLASVTPSTTR